MRRHLTAIVVAAVAVPFLAAATGAQTKQERTGITNFTRVDAVVACGGATETAALAGLKHEGFASIVNLRLADEPGANIAQNEGEATKVGLKYFHLPFQTNAPDPTLVDRFLATVSDKSNQPVYIHCGSANRVAALWLIKRVQQDGWSTGDALKEAKAIGLTSAPLEKFSLDYLASHKK